MAKTAVTTLQPIILCIIAISLMGCIVSNDGKVHHINGPTMGTWYNVKFQSLPNQKQVAALKVEIDALLLLINQQMSTYIEDSELSRFNQLDVNKPFEISTDTARVLAISQQVYEQSKGAFDITVGPLVNLWGFGPLNTDDQVPSEKQIQGALKSIGAGAILLTNQSVTKSQPVKIDLSAVAKGYAVDRIAQYLESEGIFHYMVEVGGEIRVGKRKLSGDTWKIAIEEPTEGQRAVQKVLSLESVSVATSGDYRNYFESEGRRYSHTIDPRTGKPVAHRLASVTVLHRSSAYADAYATAITVMGPEKGFAFAESLGLTVYMLVKTDNGFDVLQSKSFSSYVQASTI